MLRIEIFLIAFTLSSLNMAVRLKTKIICKDEKLEGSLLKATCINSMGEYKETEISLDECIANFNGKMLWTDNPIGFYSESCSDCTLTLTILKCKCKKIDDSLNETQVDITEGIFNNNGTLKCMYDKE